MPMPKRIEGQFYDCNTGNILKVKERDIIAFYPRGTLKICRPNLSACGTRCKGTND